jgi:dihydroneopterin aldolase
MRVICIKGLELWTHIGIPEEERMREQRVLIDVRMELASHERGTGDDLSGSIDYEMVARRVRLLAQSPHRTLEKFGEDIVTALLQEKNAKHIEIILHKFILPGTGEVSVTVARNR